MSNCKITPPEIVAGHVSHRDPRGPERCPALKPERGGPHLAVGPCSLPPKYHINHNHTTPLNDVILLKKSHYHTFH